MNKTPTACLFLLTVTFAPAFAQLPDDFQRKFDEAEQRIVRLPPTAFPDLPGEVVRAIQRRRCRIPQEAFTKKPHNVIRGHFMRPGQTDWAVLCSVNGRSSILVFWNGSATNPAEFAPMGDRNYLQGISATGIGFSRGISAANREFILRHNHPADVPPQGLDRPPQVIDHQGIDDAFIEKASVTWYFHEGKWLQLMGAD
jgi:hypothetical protein